MKKVLDPRAIGIRVKKVLKIRREVVVELESKGEVEKFKRSEVLRERGFKMESGRLKNPVVMVYGVEASIPERDVLEYIYKRNVGLEVMTREEFSRDVVVRHKYVNRAETQRRGADFC